MDDFVEALQTVYPTGTTPLITDYNCPDTNIGAFRTWQQLQFKDGTRASSSRTFLNTNVMDKKGNGVNGRKLKVLTEAVATKIDWGRKIQLKPKESSRY